MKRFVCEECGKILDEKRVVVSRSKMMQGADDLIAKLAESHGDKAPPEKNYHSVRFNEGCAPGAMGGIWRTRLCGPLRKANAQDEYLEQLGVVRRG